MATELPTVVALMATRDRPVMAVRAARLLYHQSYAGPIALVVFNDGATPLVLDGDRPLYTQNLVVPPMSLPKKRNAMMRLALEKHPDPSTIYIIWDDDDYHGPHRVRRQAEVLIANPKANACVFQPTLYYDQPSQRVRSFVSNVADATLAFRRSFWEERPWDETIDPGSGPAMMAHRNQWRMAFIPGQKDYIIVRHGTEGPGAQRLPAPELDAFRFQEAALAADEVEELLR